MNDYSYKLGFVFAIALHIVLVFFLLIKFTASSRSFTLNQAHTINATVVNEGNINSRVIKKTLPRVLPKQKEEQKQENIVKPDLPEPITKPQIKDQIKDTLQESLLAEQAKEVAELKKEKQARKKSIAKKQEQQMQKMQKMLHDQAIAEQKQLSDELSEAYSSAAGSQGEIDKYKAMIIQVIISQWIIPDGVNENDFDKEAIEVGPDGTVLSTKSISSSNNVAMNRSAQAAVWKASPLPVPPQGSELLDEFRKINLKFTPKGVVAN